MSLRFKSILPLLMVAFLVQAVSPATGSAQLQSPNTVDFDLSPILSCASPDPQPPPFFAVCNTPVLVALIDDLIQSEAFLDQLVIGYRNDMPAFFINQLDDPLLIQVSMMVMDGPGGTLAVAGPAAFPGSIVTLAPNPFLRRRGGYRAWSLPRFSTIVLDVEDVPFLVLTDMMVDVAVHEAFHAMGHPANFDITGLNDQINIFGQINFVGDRAGINGIGWGLTEYRAESGNPFALFIPLQQDLMPGDTPGHLSPFDPTFVRPDEMLQEVFIPSAPLPGTLAFMSRSLQGMFADLGYRIKGVNAPGFMDINLDGLEDDPLIINPELPTDP